MQLQTNSEQRPKEKKKVSLEDWEDLWVEAPEQFLLLAKHSPLLANDLRVIHSPVNFRNHHPVYNVNVWFICCILKHCHHECGGRFQANTVRADVFGLFTVAP